MKVWLEQEAQVSFDDLLDRCLTQGMQVIARNGVEVAVLVPVEVWRRLELPTKPSLKDLLLSDKGRGDLVLPKRGRS